MTRFAFLVVLTCLCAGNASDAHNCDPESTGSCPGGVAEADYSALLQSRIALEESNEDEEENEVEEDKAETATCPSTCSGCFWKGKKCKHRWNEGKCSNRGGLWCAATESVTATESVYRGDIERIDFGGTASSDDWRSASGKDKKKDFRSGQAEASTRAAFIHAKSCKNGACEKCVDVNNGCWRGVSPTKKINNHLAIEVPANGGYDEYVGETWVRCGAGEGKWMVDIVQRVFKNGKLSLRLTDTSTGRTTSQVLADDNTMRLSNPALMRQGTGKERLVLDIDGLNGEGEYKMELIWQPKESNKPSSVRLVLQVRGKGIRETDDCLGMKECLSVFGNVNEDTFALRNDPAMQYQCLTERQLNQHNKVCQDWLTCLTGKQEKELTVLLGAGLGKKSSLLESANRQHSSCCSGEDTCVSPISDDPEAWDCDCHEAMQKTCKDRGQDGANHIQDCFSDLICENPKVCCGWKQKHCSGTFQTCSSLTESNNSEATPPGASLEESLSDKRTCG